MKAIIFGGGIESHTYERAPAIAEVGAGISLWGNAIRALGELGLTDSRLVLILCAARFALNCSTLVDLARLDTPRGGLSSGSLTPI